jgi:hypothetical protein
MDPPEFAVFISARSTFFAAMKSVHLGRSVLNPEENKTILPELQKSLAYF